MDTIHAAILLEIIGVFEDEVSKRHEIGDRYTSNLSDINEIETPIIDANNSSVFAQYTILGVNRKSIQSVLKENDIPSVSYYSIPLRNNQF